MKILIVNPNTCSSMTDRLRRELERTRSGDTELRVTNPVHGPLAIEDEIDEAAAIPPMLALLRGEADRFDAAVIACFSDPGLDDARRLVPIPVAGMMESSVRLAATLGRRFSILTSHASRVDAKVAHLARLGLADRLASVRPLDMGVLQMDAEPEVARERILEVGGAAVREDGADVLILGCAGLAGHAILASTLGVPLIDPGAAALAEAERLVRFRQAAPRDGLSAR